MPEATDAPTPLRRAPIATTATGLRRTPCIGICSTTYGDLVCRGCKRFAHEIVGWNGYQESQRDLVWSRLRKLLGESVRAHLRLVDEARLRSVALDAKVPDAAHLPADVLAFETMRRSPLPLAALGLAPGENPRPGQLRPHPSDEVRDAMLAIDREFYLRSRAHFEASFKHSPDG